jgi:hypothetical protein
VERPKSVHKLIARLRRLDAIFDVKCGLHQVQGKDYEEAELLRLIKCLDNQDLWYELFQAGTNDEPLWLAEALKSRARFSGAILQTV